MKNKKIIMSFIMIFMMLIGINEVEAEECTYTWKCVYKNLATNKEYYISGDTDNDLVSVDGTDRIKIDNFYSSYYDTKCNIVEDGMNVLSGDVCNKFDFPNKWPIENQHACNVYIAKIDVSSSGVNHKWVALNSNPAENKVFKSKLDIIEINGEYKKQYFKITKQYSEQTNPKNADGSCPKQNSENITQKETSYSASSKKESVEYDSFYNDNATYYKCGKLERIPKGLPKFTNMLYKLVKVIIPVILIIMGMIDFLKAVTASDEKIMDANPKNFLRRIIIAVLIYFILTVVQLLVQVIGAGNEKSINSCFDCFINGTSKCRVYEYKF